MEYLKIDETAPKWGIGVRRVQLLCAEGKIAGAVRFGRSWMIPVRAVLPNARKKEDEPLYTR